VDGTLAEATTAGAVLRNWEQIKRGEKAEAASREGEPAASGLDDIPRTMPATLEAGKIGSRAAKVGFDWPDADGIFAKLQEEIAELKAELAKADQQKIEDEFGDLLFTAVNLARHLKVDAESALRGANAKFRGRFRAMEATAGGYDALTSLAPEELDALWNRAKSGLATASVSTAGNGSK
jgi:XTP/dITP diphosphohydrolase/ATP diphosphatase